MDPDTEMDCQMFAKAEGPVFVETMRKLELYYGDGEKIESTAPQIVLDVVQNPSTIQKTVNDELLSPIIPASEGIQRLGSDLKR